MGRDVDLLWTKKRTKGLEVLTVVIDGSISSNYETFVGGTYKGCEGVVCRCGCVYTDYTHSPWLLRCG